MTTLQPAPPTEQDVLIGYLDGQRRHLLASLDGLDEEALHRPMFPSQWNCTGLIHHLSVDVERWWFQAVIAGEPDVIAEFDARTEEAWHVGARLPSDQIIATYCEESARSNEIIRARDLDDAPAWWPTDLFGDFRLHTVREIILNVIVETAAHAGHADIVRELNDGKQWLVLTNDPEGA